MDFSSVENRTLNNVIKLSECKSITRAAKELFLTQPALSKFLNNLERQLGVKLFLRTNEGLIPTYEGELFLCYAQQINSLEKQLKEELMKSNTIFHSPSDISFVQPIPADCDKFSFEINNTWFCMCKAKSASHFPPDDNKS